MKKVILLLATGLFLFSATGCKEKKSSEEIIVQKVVESKISNEPVRMQEYSQSTDVEWGGVTVKCNIKREPDESKTLVADERGQKFVDNKIVLVITKADSSVILERTFGKADFATFLNEQYKTGGLLEGIVFDKMVNDTLHFAASVSLPQTDEYIPLLIKVTKKGVVSISLDEMMDTNGEG